MKRRDFLRTVAPLAATPMLINGLNVNAMAGSLVLDALAGTAVNNDHVLVIIQLNGGNDGLNTVIPLDQYTNLNNFRSNILIKDSKILSLPNYSGTGLHPALSGLHNLYKDGMVNIVQGVSYPNPNFSHFRATDIWMTGADSKEVLKSGWVGRFLDTEYPNYPTNYPNTDNPDPIGIQVGSVVQPAFNGPSSNMGIAITSTTSFYNLITGTVDPAPNTPAGHELTYLREVALKTNAYNNSIKAAAGKATNKSTLYPAGRNDLAKQLKIVAQLIAGGLKTKIYMVSMGGFDTHSAQVDTAASELGSHATLLKNLNDAIFAFQDDLKLLKVEDRVMGMTFSEFGRRIVSNASLGTDHGAAAPMFIFGAKAKGGMIGSNPTIGSSVTVNDNLPMQYDFRSVYATILEEWFGLQKSDLEKVLLKNYQTLPLIQTSIASQRGYGLPENAMSQNFPNPFENYTNITVNFEKGTYALIQLFDMQGRVIKTINDSKLNAGPNTIQIDGSDIQAGQYVCRLQTNTGNLNRYIVKVR
ncbi:MAG: DUF1501 domain-containing protein [Bacteroidota bacterium]|nr:DUF1501 domain-containing protein [Bacteroidota bacterium]